MSTKLEQCDWEEILGYGSVNSQWLNPKEYIKIIENEFFLQCQSQLFNMK